MVVGRRRTAAAGRTVGALLLAVILSSCGSGRGKATPTTTGTSVPAEVGPCQEPGTFNGANAGEAIALVIFPNGTSGSRLLAAAQTLLRDFYAHEQAYVTEGVIGVASYVCSPRAVQVIYRTDLTPAQLNVLKSNLLAHTGGVTVEFGH